MLIVISLLGLVEIFLIIRIPFVNADLINALVSTQWEVFKHWAMILLLFFAAQLLIGVCTKYLLVWFNENLEKNIRNGVFGYVLAQPATFTEKHSTGDILSRLLNDTPKIKGFITGVALQFCFDTLAIVIAFSILIDRSWVLSLIVFAFAPLAILAGSFFKAKIGAATREVQEKVSVFTAKAQTWVSRFAGVKIYGIEAASLRQFEGDSKKYTFATINAGKWNILMGAVNAVFLGAPSVLVLVVGGYYCLQGGLSIGELFAFLTFSTYFIAPLQRIIALINVELPRIYPIFERFREFGIHLTPRPSLRKREGECTLLEVRDLEYEKSGFRLSVTHLKFHLGKVYGIRGDNGSGKSTLAKILKGVLISQSGTINYPDNEIFLLSQHAFFFDGSLQDNVTLFEQEVDAKKYRDIVRRLDMEKYEALFAETANAERSRMISGGELQKVNIARLMYSSCRALILDEPDSFTDAATKNLLKEWIMEAQKDKIIIVITHDSELLDICDGVYSLEQVEPKHSVVQLRIIN